jgi:hypothetical protein
MKPAGVVRGGETTFYCSACKLKTTSRSLAASHVFLCNKIKHGTHGEAATCFTIWHKHWRNGTLIPKSSDGDRGNIRARKPGNAT